MTLNQLRYFCAAARYHSITKAAKSLFVTQPTVSIAIRDLEHEFSITLFAYTKNRLELTQEGEEFFERASYLLQCSDEFQLHFSDSARGGAAVRLGIPPMLGTLFFPELLDAFRAAHPDIFLELSEYGSVRACDLVQDEILDVGLVNMELYNIDKFSSCVLSEEDLLFCVTEDHPFADRKKVTIQDLDGQNVILFNNDSVQNRMLTQQFHALDIQPRVILHCSQIITTLKFLRQGKCGAFFFGSMLKDLPELKGIPVEPSITMKVGLVWKKGKYISEHTKTFIEFCMKELSSVINTL